LISNPESTARRVEIEKRLDGANKAGEINTGSPTTPISTPQNPPPARAGPKGPYHVSTINGILYKNEDVGCNHDYNKDDLTIPTARDEVEEDTGGHHVFPHGAEGLI
jgi:hypothetical protein